MPTKITLDQDAETYSPYLAALSRMGLISSRRVRPVVTRSGARARGYVSSLKAPEWARFESGLERDMLRLLEVSSLAKTLHTHPFVMGLRGLPKAIHYTPDVVVEFVDGGAVVEVKGKYFLRRHKQRSRMALIADRLRCKSVKFVLVTEDDIRPAGLQKELCELLRSRRLVIRGGRGLDMAAWDPLHRAGVDIEWERRWLVAQRECDALLKRVMRRDPGELLQATC